MAGAFSEGRFGGISFGIDNLIEMKVKDKKDTAAEATKKIRLIDGLSINGGYNLIADSLNWSQINMSLRSTLFNNVNITGSANLDPYNVDSFGRRINKLLWKEGSIGRITNGSLAVSTSLKSKSKEKGTDQQNLSDETLTPDEEDALFGKIEVYNLKNNKEYLEVRYILTYNSKGNELQIQGGDTVHEKFKKIEISI